MSTSLRQRGMTRDAFFAWVPPDDRRYEFDGFAPVAMTGGTVNHHRIAANVFAALAFRLRGQPWEALGGDQAVPSIRRYVILESRSLGLAVFERAEGTHAWTAGSLVAGDVLRTPEIGIEVPVDAFYERVEFQATAGEE